METNLNDVYKDKADEEQKYQTNPDILSSIQKDLGIKTYKQSIPQEREKSFELYTDNDELDDHNDDDKLVVKEHMKLLTKDSKFELKEVNCCYTNTNFS